MGRGRRALARLGNFLSSRRAEEELEREIAAHLALLQDDFERRGLSREEARQAARRAYGGVAQVKELHRDERSIVWLEQARQDLRHAARGLRRNPGFTLVAVITLTLGIGVNAALFTVYNTLALKPLPVSDPGSVVRVRRWFASGGRGDIQLAFSYPEYVYCREHQTVFSSLVAASWPVPVLSESEKLSGQLVSANYFAALGIGARLGRTFLPEEDRSPGASPVIVLSYAYWQLRFQGDARALGTVLRLNGTAFTVIGVAPPEFTGTSVIPETPNFWAPVSMQGQLAPGSDWLHAPDDDRFQMLARLRPSISLGQAQAEMQGLMGQFASTHRERDQTTALTLHHTRLLADADDLRFQAMAAALMLIVGLVLLVAGANLANMLLARGAARQREIAIRLALGAARGRVVRHLVAESVLLALMGGAAGVVLASWTGSLLGKTIEDLIAGSGQGATFQLNLSPDLRVFAYALLLSTATGILFGLSPALQCTRPDLTGALKQEGSPAGAGLSRSRLRSLLVGAQVAVSMLLLIGAGFLTRGLLRSERVDPGFETKRLFVLLGAFGQDAAKSDARQRSIVERLRGLPQIQNAAVGGIPARGTRTPPMIAAGQRGRTLASYASENYFETLGIPLVRGRGFSRRGGEPARMAVISEATVRRFWPAEDPIGKRFQLDMDFRGRLAEFEVIGVVKDIRYANLTRVDPAHVYLAGSGAVSSAVLLRTQADPQATLAAVRKAVAESDPDLVPSVALVSMEEGLRLAKALTRAYGLFAIVLAALALTLAAVGIYGVMAYLVGRRVKEIGIRMALGATAASVLKAVVLDGLRPVFAGMAVGMAAAAALASILHATLVLPASSDLFYGVRFYDPATFLGLAAFLAGVAAMASLAPARRALRVDPMAALRHE